MKTMKKLLTAALMVSVIFVLMLTCAEAVAGNDISVLINLSKSVSNNYDVTDALTSPTFNKYDIVDALTAPTVKLPASLQIIDDEAFEGTAIVVVELPDSVESIGERAFANITSLRTVKIPDNTRVIAKSAFVGSDKVTIAAAPGSYARTFARENGLPFAPIAVMTASTGITQVVSASQTQRTRIDINTTGLDSSEEETPRWRQVDEIHTEQFDQCIANCIVGRAPPACA